MTPGFRFAPPESKIRRERASPTIAIEWRKMEKRVTSVASRTWCLDRHGFANALASLRWKRAKIHRGSRRRSIKPRNEAGYTSAVVTLNRSSLKSIAIGRGPYTSRQDRSPRRSRRSILSAEDASGEVPNSPVDWPAHNTNRPSPTVGMCAGCQRAGRSFLRHSRLAQALVADRNVLAVLSKPFDAEARIKAKGFGHVPLRLVHLAQERVGGREA